MQTRSPEQINPVVPSGFIWRESGGQAELTDNLPIEPVQGQAFRGDGLGRIEMAIGEDLTDDPVWENAPGGGIQLKM